MSTATKPVARGLARLRTPIPLILAWRHIHYSPDGTEVAVVEHVWCSRSRWEKLPHSKISGPDAWMVYRVGPFVCAHRLMM